MLRLIVYAPSVHTGGGKSLLVALLQASNAQGEQWSETLAILDRRLEDNRLEKSCVNVVSRVEPTFWGRLLAESKLASTALSNDVVLCFGNLPPFLKVKGIVATFVQNALVVSTDPGVALPLKWKWSVRLQRIWFSLARSHSNLFLVQTVSMRDRLIEKAGIPKGLIEVIPFCPEPYPGENKTLEPYRPQWDFGYISLPWPYKNHRRLIQAWKMLAEEGVMPSLVVTVPTDIDADLARWIAQMSEDHKLRITNLGHVSHECIGDVYRAIGALIFPSLAETIGLPLLEAQFYKLPILAAERDYVRDVIEPVETFDAESPRSIMRAVLRFLRKSERPREIGGAGDFLDSLFNIVRGGALSAKPEHFNHQ